MLISLVVISVFLQVFALVVAAVLVKVIVGPLFRVFTARGS